ncbi:MAG: nucleotidyltransferase domain-containing protein [Candidatus Thermoplasmatota archaeon]
MKLNEKIVAYSYRFVSFLQKQLEEKFKEIDQIILYGSVAKGTAEEESDVDIFIDTEADIETDVETVLEQFYESKDYMLFRSKGVENEINIKTGKLSQWKELHRSITATGKVLWGDFKPVEAPIGTQHQLLFHWNKIGKSRTAFLNKLYGYQTQERKIKGLLEEWDGKKVGKSAVLIPFKYKNKMFEILKKYEVNAKNIELFTVET